MRAILFVLLAMCGCVTEGPSAPDAACPYVPNCGAPLAHFDFEPTQADDVSVTISRQVYNRLQVYLARVDNWVLCTAPLTKDFE